MSGGALAAAAHRPHPGRPPVDAARLVNVLALALALATAMVLLISLRTELGYDRFHRQAGRIYRMYEGFLLPGKPVIETAFSPLIMAPTLRRELPEVTEAARILPYFEGITPGKVAIRSGAKQFYEPFAWADASVFRIFTLPLVAGDPATALARPNTVLLSASAARAHFPAGPPLGQVLKIDTGYSDEDYTVTGVFADLPFESHFHPAVLTSFSSLDHVRDSRIVRDFWWANDAYTYVLLAPGVPAERLRRRFPAFVAKHYTGQPDLKAILHMQPLADIHLRSHLQGELEAGGDPGNVVFLAAAAGAALVVALCNFLLLSTARSSGALREAAVRKALGARRGHLFRQCSGEALAVAAAGMLLALALVWLALPAVDALAGKPMTLPHDLPALLATGGAVLLFAAAAGGYAARLLSAPSPAAMLAGAPAAVELRAREAPRRVLVAFELAAAVALLAGAAVMRDQVRFLRREPLGFDQRRVMVVPLRDVALVKNFRALKEAMMRGPGVAGVTFASQLLGHETPQITVKVGCAASSKLMGMLFIDHDFTRVFRLAMAAGRPLEEADAKAGFLVNEAALRLWNLGSPQTAVGTAIDCGIKKGKIVGVVRDFHHQALKRQIEPLIMLVRPLNYHYMYLDVVSGQAPAAISHLDVTWRRMVPDKPCDRFWLAGEYEGPNRGEEGLARLAGLGSLAALLIACCGLVGLTWFTLEKRAPELAIRRGLGASGAQLAKLVGGRLTVPALAAVLVAWPASYLLMSAWLGRFAYRTAIDPVDLLGASTVVLAAASVTVAVALRHGARADSVATPRRS